MMMSFYINQQNICVLNDPDAAVSRIVVPRE